MIYPSFVIKTIEKGHQCGMLDARNSTYDTYVIRD